MQVVNKVLNLRFYYIKDKLKTIKKVFNHDQTHEKQAYTVMLFKKFVKFYYILL